MHEQFMQKAIELASQNVNSGEGGPYGAVIVKDQQIISACANKVTGSVDPTAHAEIMAIREACKQLNDFQLHRCILYSSCEPCPMCLGAIYWSRLAEVYFACGREDAAAAGFDDSFIYDEIAMPPSQRHITMLQLKLKNACQPFELWNGKADKLLY